MEIADILRHRIDSVALGIDSDENNGHLVCLVPQIVEPSRNVRERGRADVRTVGKAEEHHRRAPDQRFRPDLVSVVIRQAEVHGGQSQRQLALRFGRTRPVHLPPTDEERDD